MKLKTSIILCSVLAATSAPAMANPAWDLYVGATIGAGGQTMFNDGHDKTETAQSFGGMFGIDLPVFRVEAEYNYLKQSEFHANLAVANVYFKMPSTVVKPYLGLGFGVMFDGKSDKFDKNLDTSAAYQAMLGVTLGVPTLPFKFDIEARGVYVPDIAKIGNNNPDLLQYEGRVKIRYLF